MLEEAHGICAVAVPAFEIACGASDELLYALLAYVLIAAYRQDVFTPVGCAMRTAGARPTAGKFGKRCIKWCAWRTLGLIDEAQLHVKLLAMQKAYRLQSPAWPPLRRFRPTKFIRRKQLADFIFAFRCGG
ncbi:hypothetical protein [Undibacterium parvum]|uniref:Uncharacterized protein n=1 Tax=Undibacterium parvum TaxID=401471 RepID=A0A3Q9BTP5_9BURK|nr:hypothetical protein [Undibacterium parvum]AZP13320.1 hypothetical protein EJN92_15755 [Undibacterium parvum]